MSSSASRQHHLRLVEVAPQRNGRQRGAMSVSVSVSGPVREDTRKRRPREGAKHVLLRNVPLATMRVIEEAAEAHHQNATGYIIQLLNRYAEKRLSTMAAPSPSVASEQGQRETW